MTGDAGQRFQELLRAMGITRSYAILRALPVDTLGLSSAQVGAIVDSPQVRKVHKAIVERIVSESATKLALFVGPAARRLRAHVLPASVAAVELKAWRESGSLASWKQALQQIKNISYQKDVSSPTFKYDGQRGQIPRIDLPYGTLRWQGSSGDRAVRSTASGPTHDYYKVMMPRWAFDLPPEPLSQKEEDALETAPERSDAEPID
jgi:hypothetical protein